MTTIATINAKGGSGKSTTALVLATTLAANGATVTAIDCDPNQPIAYWATGQSKNTVKVVSAVDDTTVASIIAKAEAESDYVIVDSEGTASLMTSRILARTDLALIPMKPAPLEYLQAVRSMALIQGEGDAHNRTIPFAFCITRASHIPSGNQKAVMAELEKGSVPAITTPLYERDAFASMFGYRLALDELANHVPNIEKAIANADAFTSNVLAVLADAINATTSNEVAA